MYTVIKNVRVGATINEGKTKLQKLLSDCTQEELQALYHEIGLTKHIRKESDEAPPKKKRDNKKGQKPTRRKKAAIDPDQPTENSEG